jgi:putative methionine-R-sulfoxide reductase with GAF domain
MNQVEKYRSYLSVYLVILIIAIIGAYIVSFNFFGFNYILAGLTLIIVLAALRLYTLGVKFYKQTKDLLKEKETESQEEITINDIINQKSTEEEEEKQHQEEEFDKLITQLSSETDPLKLSEKLLSQLGKELSIVQGLVYKFDKESDAFQVISTYAYYGEEEPQPFKVGEGLSGQAARDKKQMVLKELPENYAEIISGLGKRKPILLLLSPMVYKDKTVALTELAFFEKINDKKLEKLDKILNKLAKHYSDTDK